jgi:1,4-alpha-glucan branching enzyme
MSNSMSNPRPLRSSSPYLSRKPVKPVHFICLAPDAKQVILTGDFNGWNATAAPMKRQVDGSWHAHVSLPPGHHHYLFLVDGTPTLDPKAIGVGQNEKGEKVSMIAVS